MSRSVLSVGEKVLNGRYEILKEIHSKGMSNVYLVIDNNLNKQWCLKEIRKSEAGRDDIEYYSLLQEAKIMKGLNNPNIPRIVTIEEEGDSIFIVMDFVDGISLKSYVLKYGNLREDIAIKIISQITEVMSYLHNKKNPIFYRDMKPENVMLQNDGSIRLLDFGISMILDEPNKVIDKPLGTKGYAPTEQGKVGALCDLRSDIYAIGKTLYFLLTGINPALYQKNELKPIHELLPNISSGIENIIEKCIKEDPNERYQNCEELIYDLKNYKNLEKGYINKLKFKVKICLTLFILSILFISGSFIPLGILKSNQDKEYENLVNIAQQSGKLEDYEKVFSERSLSNCKLYTEYIELLKSDGVFSKQEEGKLLGYLNENITEIKKQSSYGELAFNIGKLYWFYYEGSTSNEGIINSTKWFLDSKNCKYEEELSNIYYEIGIFNRDILSSITESEDSGLYIKYWNNLLKAKENSLGELLTIQVDISIVSCLNNYSYSLKRDGITYEEVVKELTDIKNLLNTYTPNTDSCIKKYNELKSIYEGIEEKIEILYKEGN